MKQKVVLGMSGGVDSSVAALLLKGQGYEVYGYFMNCGVSGKPPWPTTIDWQGDEKILREICKKLNIEIFVADCMLGYEKRIIQPMFENYEKGLTPNPDILCNTIGKFPNLFKKAGEIGAEYIATGHYARVKRTNAGTSLLMGRDKKKDQSYFLCGLNQEILNRCLFPLGDLTKEEVRKIAKKNKFSNWNKRGSRGICYLGKIDMKKFLRERIERKDGDVIDEKGTTVGKHHGAMFFTIGERVKERDGFVLFRGYKKKNSRKIYIAAKLDGNRIMIAPEEHQLLKTKKVYVNNFHLIHEKDFPQTGLKTRIRHLGELYSGKLEKEKQRLSFIFNGGVKGVAEGQILVLYKGEKLIGGGEICLKDTVN